MHGKYVQFENVLFEPKPVSKPHPPIWVGGESAPSIRRAARLGDAWYPSLGIHEIPAQYARAAEGRHRAAAPRGRETGPRSRLDRHRRHRRLAHLAGAEGAGWPEADVLRLE